MGEVRVNPVLEIHPFARELREPEERHRATACRDGEEEDASAAQVVHQIDRDREDEKERKARNCTQARPRVHGECDGGRDEQSEYPGECSQRMGERPAEALELPPGGDPRRGERDEDDVGGRDLRRKEGESDEEGKERLANLQAQAGRRTSPGSASSISITGMSEMIG